MILTSYPSQQPQKRTKVASRRFMCNCTNFFIFAISMFIQKFCKKTSEIQVHLLHQRCSTTMKDGKVPQIRFESHSWHSRVADLILPRVQDHLLHWSNIATCSSHNTISNVWNWTFSLHTHRHYRRTLKNGILGADVSKNKYLTSARLVFKRFWKSTRIDHIIHSITV